MPGRSMKRRVPWPLEGPPGCLSRPIAARWRSRRVTTGRSSCAVAAVGWSAACTRSPAMTPGRPVGSAGRTRLTGPARLTGLTGPARPVGATGPVVGWSGCARRSARRTGGPPGRRRTAVWILPAMTPAARPSTCSTWTGSSSTGRTTRSPTVRCGSSCTCSTRRRPSPPSARPSSATGRRTRSTTRCSPRRWPGRRRRARPS